MYDFYKVLIFFKSYTLYTHTDRTVIAHIAGCAYIMYKIICIIAWYMYIRIYIQGAPSTCDPSSLAITMTSFDRLT